METNNSLGIDQYNKPYIFLISMAAALGGFLFGYDMVVISGAITDLRRVFSLNTIYEGWAVGSCIIGSIIGTILAGKPSDIFGRKKALIVTAVFFIVGSIGSAVCDTFSMFIFYRIVGGISVGAASMLSPMYIAELSPAPIRGRMVSIEQMMIVIGIMAAAVSNYFIGLMGFGEDTWRWMLGVTAIPSVLFFLFVMIIPESPRWLLKKNRGLEAEKVMAKIGGNEYAKKESFEITKNLRQDDKEDISEIFKPGIRKIILIGSLLAIFSQFVGMNTILIYVPDLMNKQDMSASEALLQSVFVSLVNLIFTFLAMFLIDKTGRKKLLFYGVLVMSISMSMIYYGYSTGQTNLVLAAILLFVAAFAASMGPVSWVMLSEIFPNRVRGVAMSIATFSLWVANFLLLQTFPIISTKPENGGVGIAGTFGIYAIINILCCIFVWYFIPETKGKSLEEIEKVFKK